MRIRTGFVSNSSSSSFVLVGDADAIQDVLKQFFNTAERKYIRQILGSKRKGFLFGRSVANYSNIYYTESMCDIYRECFPDVEDTEDMAFGLLKRFLKECANRNEIYACLEEY